MNTKEIISSDNRADSFLTILRNGLGSPEEKYKILINLYRESNNNKLLEAAIDIYPTRLDAYYYKMVQHKGYSEQYEIGKKVVHLVDEAIDNDIYNYLFLLSFSIAAFYSGHYDEAYTYGNKLITRQNLPDNIRTQAIKNLAFFKEKQQAQKNPFNDIICKVMSDIIIIDNFYKDPIKIREFALSQPFEVKGNYPGKRTISYGNTPEMKGVFEKIMNKKITLWPDSYNGSFQYTTKDMHSWIHRDQTDYSAVVFLTPDPPLDGGTYMYRHSETGEEVAKNPDLETRLSKDSYNMNEWDIVDFVGNKFNRVVIFNGRRSHKSGTYFGNDLHTGRLFQTFFFDVEK